MIKMTTTITAIVTQEDDEYRVYFNSSLQLPIGRPISSDCWYATDKSPFSTLEEAKAYAGRTAKFTDLDRDDHEMMDGWTRIGHGNYQGCWNAPIMYRTSQSHDGDLWPI